MAKFNLHEIFFILTGIGMLASLPWLEGAGLFIWFSAKLAYFIGLSLFIKKCFLD